MSTGGFAPIHWTLSALSPLIADGTLKASALLDGCLARIAAHDRQGACLSSILRLNPAAEADAFALDAERAATGAVRGPLHGVPLVLKDNIDVAGLPTTSGSRALANAVPRYDAEQTSRLRAAGAVILGKTNLSEFSFEIRSRSSLGGDVLNPFNRAVTAGGSSGGTAAAVVAGFAVAGLGTDTGGSIRVPAAFNGLVGLRPTYGSIDMRGTAPLAPSTDTIGPIARSVADVACLFAVMTGAHDDMSHSRGLHGTRIGVLRQAFGEDTEIHTAINSALVIMSEAGATIIDSVALPAELLPIDRPHVVDWEFGPAFDAYLKEHFAPGLAPAGIAAIYASDNYLPDYRETLARRATVASLDAPVYREILAYHRRLKYCLSALMDQERIDAIVYPTSAVIPTSLNNPAGGWAPELAACSGFPALTLPVGQAKNGIPIGIEFLGRAGAEPTLFGLARDLERAIDKRYSPELG